MPAPTITTSKCSIVAWGAVVWVAVSAIGFRSGLRVGG
jgi:hypothetical protein